MLLISLIVYKKASSDGVCRFWFGLGAGGV
jgi:hypothetical protein